MLNFVDVIKLKIDKYSTDEYFIRPVGRGVRGGSLELPFWPPKDFIYTCFNCIYILSALLLESGPLVVSQLLRITAVQASLVAAMRVCSWRIMQCWMCSRKLFTPLRWKLRRRVNMCVNKSLCQALKISPVVHLLMSPHLATVLLTLVPSLMEI